MNYVHFYRVAKPYQTSARRLLAVFGLAFKSDLDAVHKIANETLEEHEAECERLSLLNGEYGKDLGHMVHQSVLIDFQQKKIEGLHDFIRKLHKKRDEDNRIIEFQENYIRGLQGAASANRNAWKRLRHHMSVLIVKTDLGGLRGACRTIRVHANRAAQGDLCGILSLGTTLLDKPERNHVPATQSRQGAIQALKLLDKVTEQKG